MLSVPGQNVDPMMVETFVSYNMFYDGDTCFTTVIQGMLRIIVLLSSNTNRFNIVDVFISNYVMIN